MQQGGLSAAHPAALNSPGAEPARIHAFCEDYRAGARADPDADRTDMADGRTIECPTLIL